MDAAPPPPMNEALRRTIDRELALIEGAILLVAAHGAPRVLRGGLRTAPFVLDAARAMANRAGVRIVEVWSVDESHLDLTVEAAVP